MTFPFACANIKYAQGGDYMATASMVLGILSLVTCASYSIGAFILEVLAIVFGQVAKNSDKPKQARAGFIMGLIGICVTLVGVITRMI